jgi:hypothetical protein
VLKAPAVVTTTSALAATVEPATVDVSICEPAIALALATSRSCPEIGTSEKAANPNILA